MPTWRRKLRLVAIVFFVALLALCLFRNPIAKLALNQFGPSVAGVDLKVAKVRIGWSNIEVAGIRVDDPYAPNLPQVEVANIRVAFTLLDGVRNGVWAKRVDVLEPTLHVRFDEAGNLISQFPKSEGGSGNGPIPFSELLVRDASLVIHQSGREPFTLHGMQLVGQFGQAIRVHGEVPNVFGGMAVLDADLNASTFAGQSKLTVENVAIDSKQLDELPLLANSIRQLGLSANLSAIGVVDHPADPLDLKGYRAKLMAVVQNVHSKKHGSLLDRIEINATSTAGIAKVTLAGNPLSGRVDAELQADLNQKPVSAVAWLNVQSCDLRAIAAEFVPDAELKAKISVAGKAILKYENETFKFEGGLNSTTNSISVQRVPVDDVTVTVSANGMAPMKDIMSLSGTVSGTVESQGVLLSDVAKQFQLPTSTGRVTAFAKFALPLQRITQPEFYSVSANMSANGVALDEFTLSDSTAALTVENGIADLGMNNAVVFDSQGNQVVSFAAGAKANLNAEGSVAAGFELISAPNQQLLALLGLPEIKPQGNFRLILTANNQLARAAQLETWTAKSKLQGTNLSILDEQFGDLNAECVLENGNVIVPQFEIPWRNNKFVFGGNGNVHNGLAFQSTLYSNSIQIEDVADVASRLSNQRLIASGKAGFGGVIQVNIPDWNLKAVGIRGGGNAKVSHGRFQGSEIGELDLAWEATPKELKITSGSNDFFGGSYAVDATIQNADWKTTVLKGQFENVQASRLVALSKLQLPASGVFDGGIELSEIESLESCKGGAWVSSRGVSVQRLPLEITKGRLTFNSGIVDLTSEGNVSRGRFEAKARTSLRDMLNFANSAEQEFGKIPLIVDAQLTDFPIEVLKEVLRLPADLRSMQGNISAKVNRGIPMLDGHKVCDVTCKLENMRLNQVRLSDQIVGEIIVQQDRASLTRIAGRLADGQLSGRAEVSLSTNPSGTFEFAGNRMSLRRFAMAVGLDQEISGSGTVSVRGRIGQQIAGRAELKLNNGVLAGVSVREAKFPVDWSYSQPSRLARWQCRAGVVSLAGGKVRVSSEGSYGSSLNMSTEARIERVDSSKLMVGKSVGAGTVSGIVRINAKRARSPKQLTGRFDFELANPQALELPILNQLPTVASLTPSRPGVGKDGGYVEGRIAGGLVHVDQLAIVQSDIQVLMNGTMTQEGRLDFDVTVNTNASGPADQLLELANTPLMLAAPAPVALIAKANDLLKDRVVNVHVGGVATRPTIQLQPGKQLSQSAVKFLLSSTLGSQAAEIATRRSTNIRR